MARVEERLSLLLCQVSRLAVTNQCRVMTGGIPDVEAREPKKCHLFVNFEIFCHGTNF